MGDVRGVTLSVALGMPHRYVSVALGMQPPSAARSLVGLHHDYATPSLSTLSNPFMDAFQTKQPHLLDTDDTHLRYWAGPRAPEAVSPIDFSNDTLNEHGRASNTTIATDIRDTMVKLYIVVSGS